MKTIYKCQALDLLDEIDKFRREHQDEKSNPSDFCMRTIEAIIAKRAGYESRADWTDDLKSGNTQYRKDLTENPITFY
jgi:hypothetical protein